MQRRNGNRPPVREILRNGGNRILSHLGALLLLGIGLLMAGHAHATTLVCGLDSSGSGQIDETATCIGDAGTLCPLDAVACTPSETAPACPTGGSYVSADDQCEAASWTCGLDDSLYDSKASCVTACSQTTACTAAGCPYGSSYACDTSNNCTQTGSCAQACPSGYALSSGICAAAVTCAAGSYSSTAKACVALVCPHGNAYPCLSNGGTFECSTATCIDPSTAQITTVSTVMLQNNGPTDAAGNCLGTIYIFSGRKMTCNKAGVQSGWKNCCLAGEATLGEDIGSAATMYTGVNAIETVYHLGQIAYYGSQLAAYMSTAQGTAEGASAVGGYLSSLASSGVNLSAQVTNSLTAAGQAFADGETATVGIEAGLQSYMTAMLLDPTTWILSGVMYAVQEFLLSGSCSQEDLETSMMNQAGRCHSLGSYCSDKWPLVGCVQKTEAFCCFNSMLARLIQEQGRPQLASFNPNPWGVATDDGPANADCRGFTSTEFQMLDFSKMDLSSYFGEITTQVQSAIQQNVSGQINSYYNSIQQQQ
jgi:conjugal transfer mating pair stabilization protein TraN